MRKRKQPTDPAREREQAELGYRTIIACMARSLVADMFEQHKVCETRTCRAHGRCVAGDAGGFCPVQLDNRQGCVFAGMMLFHQALRHELGGLPLLPPLEVPAIDDGRAA